MKPIAVISLLLLLFAGCSDGSAMLIEAPGFMTLFQFSATGEILFLRYYRIERDPTTGKNRTADQTLEAVRTSDWLPIARYVPEEGIMGRPYMCADSGSAFFIESPNDDGTEMGLVRWDLAANSTSELFPVDRLANYPDTPGDWSGVYCDAQGGVLYLGVRDGTATAIDPVTGEIMREYDTGASGWFSFHVVPDSRRIFLWFLESSEFFSFDLDSGDLVGTMQYWSGPFSEVVAADMIPLSDTRVVAWVVGHTADAAGIFFYTIDLLSMSVVDESILEDYTISDAWNINNGSDLILMDLMRELDNWVPHLSSVDFIQGATTREIDMTWHHQGQIFPIQELSRIYIDDWRAAGGPAARVYSFPELELLHQGRAPNPSDEKRYVSNGQFIVMTSAFNEHFGVFDPVAGRVLDDFWVCPRLGDVAYGALAVDPTERWAAMICAGINPEVIDSVDDVPREAGVAVVDLDRYR